MNELVESIIVEGSPLVIRATGAVLASLFGVFVEFNGVRNLTAGHGTIGLWMAGLGCVFLLIAYVLGTDVRDALRARTN